MRNLLYSKLYKSVICFAEIVVDCVAKFTSLVRVIERFPQ